MNIADLTNILKKFGISGPINSCKPYGNGHINASYRLINHDPGQPDYLLQRVNHEVFRDVPGMMENIEYVTAHIRKKLIQEQQDYRERVLTLIHSPEGHRFVEHQGQYWRLFEFMNGLRSYDKAPDILHAYEGAFAFGRFLNQLSDFDPNRLNITIGKFHELRHRLSWLSDSLKIANPEHIKRASKELDYIRNTADQMLRLSESAAKGAFPLRITHNDTKFNNVLFDEAGNARCVIDLDTVMPGYVAYDFGDAIRTGAATSEEDAEDIQSVDLDMEQFKAFTYGYLNGAGTILSEAELDSLPPSTAYMAFMMGVRFLDDYLREDVYFKTAYPEHNYVRARCQLRLSEVFKLQQKDMQEVVMHESSLKI